MRIAIGRNPFSVLLKKDFKDITIYPEFFDDYKALIQGDYENYVKQLWKLRNEIKFAIYPDYSTNLFVLPNNITYIFPLHFWQDRWFFSHVLKNKYNVIIGYPSDVKYKNMRNYTIQQFIAYFKNVPKWYLGISTKKKFREALNYNFEYCDITLMLLGSFEQIKNYEYVKEKLKELLTIINHPSLINFFP